MASGDLRNVGRAFKIRAMSPESLDLLRNTIRDVQDFPKPGIVFKDITPVLADPKVMRLAIDALIETADGQRIDKVAGIDARGFIFGAAICDRLGVGFVPIRKKGKLPWKTNGKSYSLEYGEASVEIHQDAVEKGENVLLVDDLLATGGTADAAAILLKGLGANILAVSFFIELEFLEGRKRIEQHAPVRSILAY